MSSFCVFHFSMMVVCVDFVGVLDVYLPESAWCWRAKAVFLAPYPRSTFFSHPFALLLNESLEVIFGPPVGCWLMILDDVDYQQLTNSLLFTECFLCRSPGWFPAFKCKFHLLVKIAFHFYGCLYVSHH